MKNNWERSDAGSQIFVFERIEDDVKDDNNDEHYHQVDH
jgi:hypothetical protein